MRSCRLPGSRRLALLLVCAGLVAGVAWHGVTHHHVLSDAGELCLALAATALLVVPWRRPASRRLPRRLTPVIALPHLAVLAHARALPRARAGPAGLQVLRR